MSEDKSQKLKKLLGNTLLFAIGQFGSALVSILFVPIYTNSMTTAEYGTADLVNNLVTMLFPLLTLSITDGIMKFSLDGRHNIKEVFSVSMLVCCIGMAVGIAAYPLIVVYGEIAEYIVLFYFILITRVIQNLFLAYVRALQKLKLYSVVAVTNTLVLSVSNVVTIVFLKMGVWGYLLSIVLGNVISGIVALIAGKLWRYIGISGLKKQMTKEMVTFSLPLIPNNFSMWAMSSMDKYMLTGMLDVSYNGLYTAAHKIPSIVSIFAAVFNQAWNYSALEEQRSQNQQEYYRAVFNIYSCYLFLIASAVMCVVRPVMLVWMGEAFREAWIYTPYLFVSTIFSCLIGFYVPLFVIAQKTQMLFISTVVGAAVNLVLNACLIPLWGINGASLATVATYVVVWIIRGMVVRKYTDVVLNEKKAYLNAALLLIQGTMLIFIDVYWWVVQVLFLLVLVAVDWNEIKALLRRVVSMAQRVKRSR